MRAWGEIDRHRMERVQAYLGLRGAWNISELTDVPAGQMDLYNTLYQKPVHFECRITKTRWCVLRLPSSSMAQQAGMSTEAFEDFYFDVCTLDYAWLAEALEPLAARMNAASDVHITGPDTDLRFSIAGIPVVSCAGEMNIPDGEVFTAPVRDSIEGPRPLQHPDHLPGCLVRRSADSSSPRARSSAPTVPAATRPSSGRSSTSDEGASYVGEWSLGCNPKVLHPMRDILFDEKIAGSFHLTPGNAYDEADNGNRSKIHWDLVQIQRPDYGGGTIKFDGEPIRHDGRFIPADLQALNADRAT